MDQPGGALGGAILDSSCAILGHPGKTLGRHLRDILSDHEAILGSSWAIMRHPGAILGSSRATGSVVVILLKVDELNTSVDLKYNYGTHMFRSALDGSNQIVLRIRSASLYNLRFELSRALNECVQDALVQPSRK